MAEKNLRQAYHIERSMAARLGISRYHCACERCHGLNFQTIKTVAIHHRKYGRDVTLEDPPLVRIIDHSLNNSFTYAFRKCNGSGI